MFYTKRFRVSIICRDTYCIRQCKHLAVQRMLFNLTYTIGIQQTDLLSTEETPGNVIVNTYKYLLLVCVKRILYLYITTTC